MKHSLKIFWMNIGIFVSGTWYGRYHTADFADSSVLYGNSILFCKKFRKTPFMVSWNKIYIKKASGQFCAEKEP